MTREQRLEAILRELNDHLSFGDAPSELLDRVDAILAEQAAAQDEREIIGVERYRVVRHGGNFGIACVKAGDGERTLHWGHISDCKRVAAELATAFEDGKFVARRPAQTEQQHPDDAAVDRFAAAMKAKLAAARAKGRGGWDDPNVCSVEFLAQLLVEHLAKGNAGTFEDVANFAMMLHQRGAEPKALADAALPAQTEQEPGQSEELAWKVLEAATDALDRRAAPHAWISQAWNAGSEVITSRRGRTEPWPAS